MDQGSVIIHPSDYPDGFIIVLVASAQQSLCGSFLCSSRNADKDIKEPIKKVKITVECNGTDGDYALATLTMMSVYIIIFVLTFLLSYFFTFKHKYSDFVKKIEDTVVDRNYISQISQTITQVFRQNSKEKTDSIGLEDQPNQKSVPDEIDDDDKPEIPLPPYFAFVQNVLDSINEKQEARKGNENDIDLNIGNNRRQKANLFVSDLSTKLKDPTRSKSVYQKSQLYFGILFLVSLFYSLPVLQMVFSFSNEQDVTGKQDICYYNDFCRKPLGPIRDFNHIFSNLGYCVFGILFMIIVSFKHIKYRNFIHQYESLQQDDHGVPTQYGLYYAMGLALFMEGVMSSCYHICPTDVTFQFDTTFMYLIAVLMFMKLYQVVGWR